MRNFFYFLMAAFLLISCSENINFNEDENNFIEVGVSFYGDMEQTYTPMTKSATSDEKGIYFVMVQFSVEKSSYAYHHPDGVNGVAYGAFTDISKMKFNLGTNKSYDIIVDYIDMSVNDLTGSKKMTNIVFPKPFWTGYDGIDINKVYYDYSAFTPFIGGLIVAQGLGNTETDNQVYNIDRYYGDERCFTPSEDNKEFNINMKYVTSSFTLDIITEDKIDEDIYFSFERFRNKYKLDKIDDNSYRLNIDKITLQDVYCDYNEYIKGNVSYGETWGITLGNINDAKKYYYGSVKLIPGTVTNACYTIKSTNTANTSINFNYMPSIMSDTIKIAL